MEIDVLYIYGPRHHRLTGLSQGPFHPNTSTIDQSEPYYCTCALFYLTVDMERERFDFVRI